MDIISTVVITREDLGLEEVSDAAVPDVPKIPLIPHTIFILCGPTSSGKSTFSEDLAYLCEDNFLSFKVISSDQIRRELLEVNGTFMSSNGGRYSAAMQTVSRQAFKTLMCNLEVVTSHPVSTEIVVVDTTGMDKKFRTEVTEVGRKNGYKVVLVTFEYKNRSDYFPPDVSSFDKTIIEASVMRFRRKALPDILAREFDDRLRIRSKNSFGWHLLGGEFGDADLDIEQWVEKALSDSASTALALRDKCRILSRLDESCYYGVIGDSHECVEELQLLITALETEFPGIQIIHVGDYLDKGGDTQRMVEFVHSRKNVDIILHGNHESYVAKRLRKEIEPNLELEEANFTSLKVLEADAELAKLFLEIWDGSVPFVTIHDYDASTPVFITHAPCNTKHLGKVHSGSLTAQRNYRTVDRAKPVWEDLAWIKEEADLNLPLHIFGHTTHTVTDRNGIKFKNKVFLDTGAVYGGVLTGVVINEGKLVKTISIPSKRRIERDLPTNLGHGPRETKKFSIFDYGLEQRDYRLLGQIKTNGVKFISGTMSPGPSTNEEIEPLVGGLEWLLKSGATSVILQPKYMGSRCQMYLFEEGPEKTFAVSRGGWKIRKVEGKTDEEYAAFLAGVWETFKDRLAVYGDMILDGELMPWAALGKGLIAHHFTPYADLITDQLATLEMDQGLRGLDAFWGDLGVQQKQIDLGRFKEVLGAYAGDTETSYRSFKILKTARPDPNGVNIFDDGVGWALTNSDPYLIIGDLADRSSWEGAVEFFRSLTIDHSLEGVVVKPLTGESKIPHLKIRSPEYLRLVYGYDYLNPARYSRLCRQKNISGKIRVSIDEYNLGMKMLAAETDREREEYAVKMICQIRTEQELDPRL